MTTLNAAKRPGQNLRENPQNECAKAQIRTKMYWAAIFAAFSSPVAFLLRSLSLLSEELASPALWGQDRVFPG